MSVIIILEFGYFYVKYLFLISYKKPSRRKIQKTTIFLMKNFIKITSKI